MHITASYFYSSTRIIISNSWNHMKRAVNTEFILRSPSCVFCFLLSKQSLLFQSVPLSFSHLLTASLNPCFTSAASYPIIINISFLSKQVLLPGCCIILVANFDSIITRIFSNRIIHSTAFQQFICFFSFPFLPLFCFSAKTVSNIVYCLKMHYLWTLLHRGGSWNPCSSFKGDNNI